MPEIVIPGGGGGGVSSGNYTLISDQTANGSQGTITFSNIPTTYKHLQLVISARSASGQALGLRFNSDAGSNYDGLFATLGNSYSGAGAAGQGSARIATTTPGTVPASCVASIVDYTAPNMYRSVLANSLRRLGTLAAEQNMEVAAWTYKGTAVVSTIELVCGTITFSSGSRFTLYGLS